MGQPSNFALLSPSSTITFTLYQSKLSNYQNLDCKLWAFHVYLTYFCSIFRNISEILLVNEKYNKIIWKGSMYQLSTWPDQPTDLCKKVSLTCDNYHFLVKQFENIIAQSGVHRKCMRQSHVTRLSTTTCQGLCFMHF